MFKALLEGLLLFAILSTSSLALIVVTMLMARRAIVQSHLDVSGEMALHISNVQVRRRKVLFLLGHY